MKNSDELVKRTHITNRYYFSDYHYWILIISGSRAGKINLLLNLINYQRPDVDKIYLSVEDPFVSKYQLLIKGRMNHEKNPESIYSLFANN